MNAFVQRHRDSVTGVLSGFDRLRLLSYVEGMGVCLGLATVPLKDFKAHALSMTDHVRHATEPRAAAAGRPPRYWPSSRENKEALARAIAERDGVRAGLIAVFSCVEPCRSYEVHRNRATRSARSGCPINHSARAGVRS